MTLYAQTVLDVPVDGPFDYSIPDCLASFARPGCRVRINFSNKKRVGYIVAISSKTQVKSVKPLIDVIDRQGPLLGANFLELTRRVARYYCCSWGTAIEIGLPGVLRKGRPIDLPVPAAESSAAPAAGRFLLLHDLDNNGRIRVYEEQAAGYLERRSSVIILVPDRQAAERMFTLLQARFNSRVCVLTREDKDQIRQWMYAASAHPVIVIGTRSAVFAPVQRLGCIIMDDEHDYGYKQDQAPHYHCRTVALMRCAIEKSDFIAGSCAPSLELMHAAQQGLFEVRTIPRSRPDPAIKLVDMKKLPVVSKRQKITVSGYVQSAVLAAAASGEKTLFFFNRKGYATLAICSHCSHTFQCPRCSVNLHFHYQANVLACHYCGYSTAVPPICPECNAGYVRFLGAGTEKLESELFRLFPKARISRWESGMPLAYDSADIFIATQAAIRHCQRRFSLVAVLGIDNALNHVDFRSGEKAFQTLAALADMADREMIIQTNMAEHYVLAAVTSRNPALFYAEESRQRRQLSFPPYRHFCFVKVRSAVEEKAASGARSLFDELAAAQKPAGVSVMAVFPAQVPRLRGNYYWQILLGSKNVERMSDFIKKQLKIFRRSGIIVTVDIDPE